jgi:hypothetical protein
MNLPLKLGENALDGHAASLARELAQGIRDPLAILAEYGFSGTDDPAWLALSGTTEFQRLLDSLTREWNAADSTKQRVRVKALASVETGLIDLHAMMTSERVDPKVRVDAFKVMKGIAGLDAPAGVGGMAGEGGGGVSIKIVIGQQSVTKNVESAPTVIEHESEDA